MDKKKKEKKKLKYSILVKFTRTVGMVYAREGLAGRLLDGRWLVRTRKKK